ncbi:MAG: hypothetical protein ACYCX7_02215 [Solirubrobacteraceae bacterium]
MSAVALWPRVGLPRTRPAAAANMARNSLRSQERADEWVGARRAAWMFLERHVPTCSQVAVIGAGNGDDLPLEQIARRCSTLSLIDVDAAALRRAVRRLPVELQRRTAVHRCDVTDGAADEIVSAVLRRRRRGVVPAPRREIVREQRPGVVPARWPRVVPARWPGVVPARWPRVVPARWPRVVPAQWPRVVPAQRPQLPGGPYDVVIGDLLYSQLLYPALLDAGVCGPRLRRALELHAPALTDALVARMHASTTPEGVIVHLHDTAGWWDGHRQPTPIARILAAGRSEEALDLSDACRKPLGADPRRSAQRLGAQIVDTAFWEWPFKPRVSYLVCASAAKHGPDVTTETC